MRTRKLERSWPLLVIAALVSAMPVMPGFAQCLDEDFNTVTGTGGAEVLNGSGANGVDNFDDGITGENAFGGTIGDAQINPLSARGTIAGGVNGTGAAELEVSDVTFHTLFFNFETVTGTGGGVFLNSSGLPDTSGSSPDWDTGISGEGAFGGTFDGAIVAGSMSAQGLTTGGVAASGAGQIIVDDIDVTTGGWFAGLQFAMGTLPIGGGGAVTLVNPGFEVGPVGQPPTGWTSFGNAFQEADLPCEGAQHAKIFQTFSGGFNVSGIFQALSATEGQIWELNAVSAHRSVDAIPPASPNFMVMKIEYLDGTNGVLASSEVTILDGTDPTDTCLANTPLSLTAPAGTVKVQPVFAFVNPDGNFDGGAGLVDAVTFDLIGGPPSIDLGGISLTADIKGEAPGAGNILGGYQLRLEDSDGDRLIFFGSADGSFQSVGGTLDTATEADSNGVPTGGVFNPNSASFNVVVAFENNTWGTGGSLTVDNLVLTDNDSTGDGWFAGIFFDGLANTCVTPASVVLNADIKGSVPGGEYVLRLEAFDVTSAGLDESFATVAGDVVKFIDASTSSISGPTSGFSADWDSGISGEGAFGGTFGAGVEIFVGGGFTASGLTSGGLGGGGAGEIKVESIIFGPGDGWFAGLDWGGQGLASTDLSQVVLKADIKGTATSGGTLGDFELRLEDAQGDRLFFEDVATGGWQLVGGTLDMASTGPALGGGGDGVFDLDSPTHTVVVAFKNESDTWKFGGTLAVDNLFLTPVSLFDEIGRISFAGVADGSFQSVGGLLSGGVSTFQGDFAENFETATGTGGGVFVGSNGNGGGTNNWDDGLAGENAFFGGATVSSTGFVSAQACTTCGVAGSKGGELSVEQIDAASGTWFAGLNWPGKVTPDLNGDLSQIFLTADIRATTTGAGSTLGTISLRLEDPDIDYLTFDVDFSTLGPGYHTVGGALSAASEGGVGNDDGLIDRNADSYAVVVVVLGGVSGTWGTGAKVEVDNLFLTGLDLEDADSLTVTVAFANEPASWGTNGILTVDNLLLSSTGNPDCDLDGDVDLKDFAFFQTCFTGDGGGILPGCDCADLDGDGADVDVADYRLFFLGLGGPQ